MAIVQLIPNGESARLRLGLVYPEYLLLKSLPAKLREVLLDPEGSKKIIDRLFPPTHRDDPEEEAEHRRLLGESLYERRLDHVRRFQEIIARMPDESGLFQIELTLAEADLWLHVINDVRLLLGTDLNIQENDWFEQPREGDETLKIQMLAALSGIQEVMLGALSGFP